MFPAPLDVATPPHFQQPQWIGEVSLQHTWNKSDNHSGQRDKKAKV